MVTTLIGFQPATGDRIETIAYCGSSGCAIFRVYRHTKTGIDVSPSFDILSRAVAYAEAFLI